MDLSDAGQKSRELTTPPHLNRPIATVCVNGVLVAARKFYRGQKGVNLAQKQTEDAVLLGCMYIAQNEGIN